MSMRAEGFIETKSWEENAYGEVGGGESTFTRASVSVSFSGDISREKALRSTSWSVPAMIRPASSAWSM